ncbi:hypothetical protein L914_21419 [Phytophthora nicotianae]|uniref:RxLR effector protein n=1 Tax=Phytophthora nicotianae TaxID=4792 RepID=W2M5Q9_PHYNI|nr:hypothetical protein L914_21419 [Phytophthora nicotianae]
MRYLGRLVLFIVFLSVPRSQTTTKMAGRILTPLKDRDVPAVRPVANALSGAITFIDRSAKWGMGSIEKVYQRLLHPLPFNMGKQHHRPDNLSNLLPFRFKQ